MAGETLTQGGMPEKEWFTLQQVADRWTEKTGTKVSPDDVLHYEEIGLLRIAALLNDVILLKCHGTSNRSLGDEIEKKYPEAKELRDRMKGMVRGSGDLVYPFAPISKQVRHGDEVYFHSVKTAEHEVFTEDFLYTVLGDLYEVLGGEKSFLAKVNRSDLRITRQELHSFEEAHGIGKPAQLPKPQDASEETKIKRLERALGALALGLAQSAPRWRNGEAPNISAIANTALEAIRENEDGSRPRGYGETTIYDAISEAIKTVQKDKATR